MRAAVLDEYIGAAGLRVEDVAKPQPGPGEVLVRALFNSGVHSGQPSDADDCTKDDVGLDIADELCARVIACAKCALRRWGFD